jgi:ferredoxin
MEELHDASQLPELTDAMKSCPVGAIKVSQE